MTFSVSLCIFYFGFWLINQDFWLLQKCSINQVFLMIFQALLCSNSFQCRNGQYRNFRFSRAQLFFAWNVFRPLSKTWMNRPFFKNWIYVPLNLSKRGLCILKSNTASKKFFEVIFLQNTMQLPATLQFNFSHKFSVKKRERGAFYTGAQR